MTLEKKYDFIFLAKDQTEYVKQAIDCLAHTFVGMKSGEKTVQEPMVGYLGIKHEEWYGFSEHYMNGVIDQGYCVVAIENGAVVGVFVGDIDEPDLDKYYEYKSFLSPVNPILFAMGNKFCPYQNFTKFNRFNIAY